MESNDFKSMSTDELWNLHERVTSALADKAEAKKAELEERLRKIGMAGNVVQLDHGRRRYPEVLPKYRNPKDPVQTWSGRGKQPHWVKDQLRAGKKLDSLLITRRSAEKRRGTG